MRRPARHVRRAARALRDDVSRVGSSRPARGVGDLQELPRLRAAWGSLISNPTSRRTTGCSSITTITRTPRFRPTRSCPPDGRVILGLLHRPVYSPANAPKGIAHPIPGIWLSGCDLTDVMHNVRNLCVMDRHHLIAEPANRWETLRIGIGTPPVRTRLGYMVMYHGVSGERPGSPEQTNRINYDPGALSP
jgi:hypothetical protein